MLPENMRTVEISEFGAPEVLKVTQRAIPTAGPDEVLIKVHAAGVNRPDLVQREGKYPPPPGASDIPGLEVAGEIVAQGSNTSLPIGSQVCALLTGGGYAEYALAQEAVCLPIPTGLSLQKAAALPETFFTVWHNLFQRAQLNAGETLLIHGGTSGIGTTAIQMGKAIGATVYATAGSTEKCETCIKLGATRAINHRQEDFVELLREETDGKGVDVILDMVGGEYIQRNMKLAALDGRLLSIAFLKGAKTEINFIPLLIKRLSLLGSTLRAQSIENKAVIAEGLRTQVWPQIESGKISPVIDCVFPLAEAAEAHRKMEGGQHIGKIVLDCTN